MYAVIKTGGKQYNVQQGDIIYIEKLNVEADSVVEFNEVVAVSTDDGFKVGTPTVAGAKVTAKVIKNGRAKKIYIFTYKAKKNVKRKMGHRQSYTKVQIETIVA